MKSHSIDRISINATLDEQAVVYYVAARTIDGKNFTKIQILSENNAASPSTNNVDASKVRLQRVKLTSMVSAP